MKPRKKFSPLKSGDLVRIIAPASPFSKAEFDQGVNWLEKQGFKVKFREDIFSEFDLFAGDDSRRLEELVEAFEDEACKAIFCARGGYGASRLLNSLDVTKIVSNPKLFCGYSDLTVLLNLLVFHCGQTAIHGPLISGGLKEGMPKTSEGQLLSLLTKPEEFVLEMDAETLVAGDCQGILFGGNLAMFQTLLGTPWQPDLKNVILFIEDVKEAPYRIDRIINHLCQAGFFRGLKGLIAGPLGTGDPKWEKEFIKALAQELEVPCVQGVGIGHHDPFTPLPVGVAASFSASKRRLVTESLLEDNS